VDCDLHGVCDSGEPVLLWASDADSHLTQCCHPRNRTLLSPDVIVLPGNAAVFLAQIPLCIGQP